MGSKAVSQTDDDVSLNGQDEWKEQGFFLTRDLLRRAVFLGVDVQRDYCSNQHDDGNGNFRGNDETEAAAKKIGGLSKQFNRFGLDITWLCYGRKGIFLHMYGPYSPLHHIQPHPKDKVVLKYRDSGFAEEFMFADQQSELNLHLREHKKDILFIGGVNKNGCVLATIRDALELGYHVILLNDICANDDIVIEGLKRISQDQQVHFYHTLYHRKNGDRQPKVDTHYTEISTDKLIQALHAIAQTPAPEQDIIDNNKSGPTAEKNRQAEIRKKQKRLRYL